MFVCPKCGSMAVNIWLEEDGFEGVCHACGAEFHEAERGEEVTAEYDNSWFSVPMAVTGGAQGVMRAIKHWRWKIVVKCFPYGNGLEALKWHWRNSRLIRKLKYRFNARYRRDIDDIPF